jgi:heme-degrading monooxygenase HmoA
MFASMRRYRLQPGAQEEFTRRVDESFADDIAAQPGFVSYQLIDCGGGDLFTLSIFLEPGEAEASRELAQRWTEDHLQDIEHTRFDAIHGESVVSRAAPGMLEPAHVGDPRKRVSIRYYRLRSGAVGSLMRKVDEAFADRMRSLPGFEASHLLDCGDDEVLWISVLRDDAAVEQADERVAQFMRDELADFRPEHVVSIRGDIAVSRADAELLEPAHA